MNDDIAIKVENVSKTFKLPHEKNTTIKGAVVNFYKRNKSYETQQALKDISFEVKKGEFFGIVGRNGSGKSTLLKMLAGIYTPSKGSITVNGKLTPFIELGVGFNQELSGRENVFLNGALLGFNRKEMDAMYDDIVEFAEIDRFMDQKLKNYSSGMQVRLAFSIAIRAQSDLLLLDEVLAVGDGAFQQKCYNYFEELKRERQTVVFVSHDMGAVKRFCTKALLLENGLVKKIGKPESIADQYIVDNITTPASKKHDKRPKHKLVKHMALDLDSNKDLSRDELLKCKVQYCLNEGFEPILGISIIREGISIAEINSKPHRLNNKPNISHEANLTVALESFNPGLYSINIALFKREDMQLLDYRLNEAQFVVLGDDQTRGGAVYIKGGWTQ